MKHQVVLIWCWAPFFLVTVSVACLVQTIWEELRISVPAATHCSPDGHRTSRHRMEPGRCRDRDRDYGNVRFSSVSE